MGYSYKAFAECVVFDDGYSQVYVPTDRIAAVKIHPAVAENESESVELCIAGCPYAPYISGESAKRVLRQLGIAGGTDE